MLLDAVVRRAGPETCDFDEPSEGGCPEGGCPEGDGPTPFAVHCWGTYLGVRSFGGLGVRAHYERILLARQSGDSRCHRW